MRTQDRREPAPENRPDRRVGARLSGRRRASQGSRYGLLDDRLHCIFIHRHLWGERCFCRGQGQAPRAWRETLPCSGGQSTAVNSAKDCPPVSGSVRRYRTVMRAARCWRCLRRAEGSHDDRHSARRDRTVVTWPGVAAGQEARGSYSVLDMRSCDGADGANLQGLVLARRSGFVRCPAEARVSRSVRPGRR